MTSEPLTTGSAIASYIDDVKNQIKAGLGDDASLAGPIDLEMSTTLEGRGGLYILLVGNFIKFGMLVVA
jgi:hypothetical protein